MPKGAGLTKPMKLSAELADIVGKKEASRAECIKQLWAYIKKNNLQDPENKQFFNPDKKMAKVRNFFFLNFFFCNMLTFFFYYRSSVTTASVLSVWPNSFLPTCPKSS